MRVVLVSPKHCLEDDIYISGAKIEENIDGLLEIRDVIAIRTFNEVVDDIPFDFSINYIDDCGILKAFGVYKSEVKELRVYVD